MKEKISIKGLANKNSLADKSLQNMSIHTINGSIVSTCDLEDLFEINIDASILDKSSIEFHDMNLNTFNCQFIFNVIAINNSNKGVFFKFTHNCVLTYKSFNNIQSYKLMVLDGFFNRESTLKIDFSLVIALDFSTESPFIRFQPNPVSNINKGLINADISLFFDKEFI